MPLLENYSRYRDSAGIRVNARGVYSFVTLLDESNERWSFEEMETADKRAFPPSLLFRLVTSVGNLCAYTT